MPFYLGALRMLNIATGYSKNTLSCSELSEEHAGEGFRSLRHILKTLWACKAKKCRFSRKFYLWPDLTRSNINLGPKTICAIARSRRGASTVFFREALRPSGADRQGGGGGRTNPPPLHGRRWQNTEYGRGLTRAPLGYSAERAPLGGGAYSAPCLTPELIGAVRLARRRSKALNEKIPESIKKFSLRGQM